MTRENTLLHERLARSSTSTTNEPYLTDAEQIKRQAYLVLEENKILQEQLDLQSNRLTDVQKHQIHEGNATCIRLIVIVRCFSMCSVQSHSTFVNRRK